MPAPQLPHPTYSDRGTDVGSCRRPQLADARRLPLTAFEIVEFRLAALDGLGWTVDGSAIVGLLNRPLGLLETRCRLLHPATRYATRDSTLDWLVSRMLSGGDDWAVVLAGMLLPGLHATLRRSCRNHPALAGELQSEALAGLLTAARASTPESTRVAARLTWAARRAADRFLHAEIAAEQIAAGLLVEPTWQPGCQSPQGDPRDVLMAAVTASVLLPEDADLISSTRLDGMALIDAAAELGVSYAAASRRRERAEHRLVAWLQHRMQTANEEDPLRFVANDDPAGGCAVGGRPRQGRRPDAQSGVRQPTTPSRR